MMHMENQHKQILSPDIGDMVFGVIILMLNLKQYALFDVIFYQIQHVHFIFGEIRIVNWVVILIEDITSMAAMMKTQNIKYEKITVSFPI